MPELAKDDVRTLLEAWSQGEDEALERLYPVYFTKIVNLLRREGHKAEEGMDIVQETFMRFHKWIRAGNEPPQRLTLYLLSSARNVARARGRRKTLPVADAEAAGQIAEIPAEARSVLSSLGSLEVRNILRESIDRLPPHCRDVYRLRLDGLKEREIAERLGLALGTVKAYIHEGLGKLKTEMEGIARTLSDESGEMRPPTRADLDMALKRMAWLYADPVRLHHLEDLPVEKAAERLGLEVHVFNARLEEAYRVLEGDLGVQFPEGFGLLRDGEQEGVSGEPPR